MRTENNVKLGTGGRIGLAIGVAGSGKSTLLKLLVRAWQDDGRAVHGIALAWRQSDDLAEAGIPAADTRAVAAFLRGLERGNIRLDRKSVVVVDEVGLLGTRQLNAIMAAQAAQKFQLVMIGDPKQMQAVEAGPVIDLLCRALGADKVPELGSSIRQKAEEERETVLMLRNGQTEEAIRRKDANGTLKIVPGGYEEACNMSPSFGGSGVRQIRIGRNLRSRSARRATQKRMMSASPSANSAGTWGISKQISSRSKPPTARGSANMNWHLPLVTGFVCSGAQTRSSSIPARWGISGATARCWRSLPLMRPG
jgi:energy-coupling factor transporter ATP-binding protein EcfA2